MSFFHEELTHQKLHLLKFCKIMVKLREKNVLGDALLNLVGRIPECQSDGMVAHFGDKFFGKLHCGLVFRVEARSLEVVCINIWVFIEVYLYIVVAKAVLKV